MSSLTVHLRGMSSTVNINLELLRAIVNLKSSPRLSLLRIADASLVTAICECFLNILNANIPLTPEVRRRLRRYKHTIRSLASSKGSWKSKRDLLVKYGDKLVPLVIDTALKYFEDESRQEDGSYFTRCAATNDRATTEKRITKQFGERHEQSASRP